MGQRLTIESTNGVIKENTLRKRPSLSNWLKTVCSIVNMWSKERDSAHPIYRKRFAIQTSIRDRGWSESNYGTLNREEFCNSTCTCPYYFDTYICQHTIAIASLEDLNKILSQCKAVLIGQKPKRGRPAKIKRALQRQDPAFAAKQRAVAVEKKKNVVSSTEKRESAVYLCWSPRLKEIASRLIILHYLDLLQPASRRERMACFFIWIFIKSYR